MKQRVGPVSTSSVCRSFERTSSLSPNVRRCYAFVLSAVTAVTSSSAPLSRDMCLCCHDAVWHSGRGKHRGSVSVVQSPSPACRPWYPPEKYASTCICKYCKCNILLSSDESPDSSFQYLCLKLGWNFKRREVVNRVNHAAKFLS